MTTPNPTPSYNELLAQREEIDRQLKLAKEKEIATVIKEMKDQIHKYDLTAEDLFSMHRSKRAATAGAAQEGVAPGKKVVAKYRDPVSGATWSGRGKSPLWIREKDREEFIIR